MLQQAARRGALAAAGAAAAAASVPSSAPECEAAAPPQNLLLPRDALDSAGCLIREHLPLRSVTSLDGTTWIDVPSVEFDDVEKFMNLATRLAEDPAVQRAVQERVTRMASSGRGLEQLAMGESAEMVERPAPFDVNANSVDLNSDCFSPRQEQSDGDEFVHSLIENPSLMSSSFASSTSTNATSAKELLSRENERLRRENAALKDALGFKETAPTPEVSETSSAAETARASVAASVAASEAEEAEPAAWACAACTLVNSGWLPMCEACDTPRMAQAQMQHAGEAPPRVFVRTLVDHSGAVRLRLSFKPVAPHAGPKLKGVADGHDWSHMPSHAALTAAAIIVGLLALIVTRNPREAKMAAGAAAAAVAGVFSQSRMRCRGRN